MKRCILILLFLASPALADNLGAWRIDDALTFAASVHNSTGAAVAADGSVYWRVYENETGTALLNGTMTRIDSTNFPGTYTEAITLSAANGFEVGKQYTVAVKAGVEGVTGEMTHNFQIESFSNYMADVSALATAAAVAALNDFDPTSDTVTVGTNNDKTGYSVSTLGANTITAGVIATDAITSDEIAASAVTEIQSGLSTLTAAQIATATEETAARVWAVTGRELSTPNNYKADVSSLATAAAVAALPDATAIAAQVVDTTVTSGDSTVAEVLEKLLSWGTGKFTKSGSTYTYYAEDGTTVLFTFTISSGGRTP